MYRIDDEATNPATAETFAEALLQQALHERDLMAAAAREYRDGERSAESSLSNMRERVLAAIENRSENLIAALSCLSTLSSEDYNTVERLIKR